MKVLVIDVGGTNVKIRHSDQAETRRFPSGKTLTPRLLLSEVKKAIADWKYDVISIGIPTPIKQGKPLIEPTNLGRGWKNFDFAKSFPRPVKLINDAALQALGSYHGGRMLFLGLGTGLGSALVAEHLVLSLELGQLNRTRHKSWEDFVSEEALRDMGALRWKKEVHSLFGVCTAAFLPDYIVVGGGNAKKLDKLPRGVERGDNRNALAGGIRLWESDPKAAGKQLWKVI